MLRLSRQAWNNVLIFSMLIMIALLNGLHKKLGGDEPLTNVPLLPEHSLVLTVDFGEFSIERIGQSWRINQSSDNAQALKKPESTQIDGQKLETLMDTWQQHTATLAPSDEQALVLVKGKMPDYYVVVTLAGKSDGAVYAFYPQFEEVIIHDQFHGRFVMIPIDSLSLLFPAFLPLEQSISAVQ